MPKTTLTGPLTERKRDALEAAWLGQLSRIPNATASRLDTAEDLYSYLLIDNRCGWELTTSVVAQVIASLQQYISNILFGSEPGYSTVRWQQEFATLLEQWQSTDAQYDTWAANILLAQYPENYLAPPLRTGATCDFGQMLNDLNQGPLNEDTILAAIQGYLNRFEEVANLSVVSGYVAGTDLEKDDYYFLGRTASKPHTYYWRRCAMHLNTVTTWVPDSWSEWLKVDLPLGGLNVVGLPRPVVLNNRLYVVWFERTASDHKTSSSQSPTPTLTLTAQMAYRKFDGTWSAPQVLASTTGNTTSTGDGLYSTQATFSTLALEFRDTTTNPFLYVGLYSAADAQCPTTAPANDKALVCALDAWMNTVQPQPDAINTLFAQYAAQTLASHNHNASVVNPQSTSQQFLQRAVGIIPDIRLADISLLTDDLKLADKMPVLHIASGSSDQTNSIAIDTRQIKQSQLTVNFTPGAMSIAFSTLLSGSGNLASYAPYVSHPFSYFMVFGADTTTLIITVPDKSAYELLKTYKGVFIVLSNVEGYIQSTDVSTQDSTQRIIAKWSTKSYMTPDSFVEIDITVPSLKTAVIAKYPHDMSKQTVTAHDLVLDLAILSGDTVLANTRLPGVKLSNTDHCTATLTNQDFSTKHFYTFNLHCRIVLQTKDDTFVVGTTDRNAVTTLQFPQSLAPATDPLPVLDSYTDPSLGTAQFIHFDPKASADKNADFAPENIRLNTLFAKELVNSAQSGVMHLLQWNTQLTPEPNLGPGSWIELTLPAYTPAVHGDSRGCEVVLYPNDNLSYPISAAELDDQALPIRVFIPSTDLLLLPQKDGQGVEYQLLRVYLQTEKTAFKDAPVVVAFKKAGQPIAAQVLNDAAWAGYPRYSGFDKALAQPSSKASMDFSNANGLYFWELFYHTPAAVAYALQSRGMAASARQWQQRIFDPSAINQGTDRQGYTIADYWKIVAISPVYAKQDPSYAIEGPTDPNALAYADPQHFRKASYMTYVQAQISLGDSYYRQLTPDSLNQALQIYTQTSVLLGPRPDAGLINPWTPISLKDAADATPHGPQLAQFEQQLQCLPGDWISYPSAAPHSPLHTLPSGVFHPPVNAQLLLLWDTLQARRYNLRHNLDINGAPLDLPLYATPLDPAALLAGEARAGTTGSPNNTGALVLAPYRYATMAEKAREASELLSSFGRDLLTFLENKDQRHTEVLGQSQLADLWVFVQQAQQQAVDIANTTLVTLNSSLDAARQRHDFYQGLVEGGRSHLESAALGTLATGSALMASVSVPAIAAGVVALPPTIFGLADGGSDYAGPLKGIAESTLALGYANSTASEALAMQAAFDRRQADWQQQAEQARLDMLILNGQITSQQLQVAAAQTAQSLATTQHQQVLATYDFLSRRFTNEALYQWLSGQLGALYYQAYDATLSRCLAAQACWQYELGDFTTRFITPSPWNSQYQGLLAGETLRLNLLQMDNAWLSRNTRSLNITRCFSLRQKLGEQGWNAFFTNLKAGQATFSLTERDFDLDYPGHYLRQIASLSVSLPALVGPYQNVRATLRQTGSSLVLKPDLEAIKFLKDNKTGNASQIKRNLNASQEVALSAGLDDHGVFILSATDGRYLPFEGTGAVSDWLLTFPNPSSAEQQQVLTSLDDVVITVAYTASTGSSAFAEQVLALWKSAT